MATVDEGALQQELAGLTSSAPEAETAAPDVETFEIPVGDQTYKIPLNAELPIKHNGQIVKAPLEKVLNAFRERSHYQDKFSELKAMREKFEAERGDLDQYKQLKEKYSAIQDWSEKNPDQWSKLWELYQNKEQHLLSESPEGADNPLVKEIVGLKQELGDLRSFKEEFLKAQEEKQVQEDMKTIEGEINTFKETYPNIDLEEKDLDGLSLKARIIQHGLDKGYPDFTGSALSFLGPDLFKAAVDKGRNEAVKAVKKDKADGILERSSTPFHGKDEFDPRNMDDEDLKDAAFAELQKMINTQ